MTVQEMARIYNRICDLNKDNYCDDCPMLPNNFGDGSAEDCFDAFLKFPDEFEKSLNDWRKENPAPTNEDKFFEVFGKPAYSDKDCENCDTELPCYNCDWWDEEYIEPKEEK